jgi:hypothetical protein
MEEQEKKPKKKPSKEDGHQAMEEEDALVAWNGVILPLQVTLEAMANVLSCLIKKEDAMAV